MAEYNLCTKFCFKTDNGFHVNIYVYWLKDMYPFVIIELPTSIMICFVVSYRSILS